MKILSTAIVAGILMAIVAIIIYKMRCDKKNGVSGCGGNCGGCALCDVCHEKKN